MRKVSEWKLVNKSFRALFYCRNCDNYAMFNIRFREYFDHVDAKSKKTKVVNEDKNGEKKENG